MFDSSTDVLRWVVLLIDDEEVPEADVRVSELEGQA
jgi:hypothetical protein